MLDAWALGFALAAGCAQQLDDAIAVLGDAIEAEASAAAPADDDDAVPRVSAIDAATLFVGLGGAETLEAKRWVRHRIRPRERLTAIAARYRVKLDDVIRWNHLDPNDPLLRRRHLRVFTDTVAPPMKQVRYLVAADESWDDIAASLRVPEHDLRVQNWRIHTPSAGDVLTAWIDPLEGPSFTAPEQPTDQPALELHGQGKSIGLPQRGKLQDGVQLPEHPLWIRGNPDHLWGSAHTITVLHRGFAILRGELGYTAGVLIGSMSRRRGGRMPPHRSHQSGRDVDIRLPLRPGLSKTKAPSADEIDWYATWALIDALVRTGQIEAVFLNEAHHGRLYEAARAMGVPRSHVHEIVRWPSWRGGADPVVEHAEGHNAHLHVRVRCGPDERKCE